MNILISGGCGYIASNFINIFFPKMGINDKLINFDAMYYCANENNVKEEIRESERYIFVKGNLCNNELVEDTIQRYQITHVIHFAAQSHVDNSFNNALQFTYDNVLGTHTLLEACRKYGKLEKFIHCSTDETYGESMIHDDEKNKTEESILCPSNPYAASKAGAELIAQSYYHSFKMPIIITRGNNVYGSFCKESLQYPEKLIPKFIKLLTENKKVTIQGSGSQIRSFLHVNDTVSAFEILLERGKIGEIYNIGCDDINFKMEFTVMEVTRMLINKIKNTENYDEWIEYIEDRPFNDSRYFISNQKIKDLGWNITIKFEDGIDALLRDMEIIS